MRHPIFHPIRNFALLCLLAVVLAACAHNQAREALAAAEMTYQATVTQAIELRDMGVIESGSATDHLLTEAFVAANEYLQRAHDFAVDEDRAGVAQALSDFYAQMHQAETALRGR